jgi:hypothetical protein
VLVEVEGCGLGYPGAGIQRSEASEGRGGFQFLPFVEKIRRIEAKATEFVFCQREGNQDGGFGVE